MNELKPGDWVIRTHIRTGDDHVPGIKATLLERTQAGDEVDMWLVVREDGQQDEWATNVFHKFDVWSGSQPVKTLREKLKIATTPIPVAGGDILGRLHFDEAEAIFHEHFDSKSERIASEAEVLFDDIGGNLGEFMDRLRAILFGDKP